MSLPNDLQSTNRRTFIRSLIGLGASATAASLFTKEALADVDYDPATQVPRIHGYRRTNVEEIRRTGAPPEYEPIYATIPRTKWEDVEAAHDARRRAEAALSDLEPAPRVAVGWGFSRGKPQRQVTIQHETEQKPDGQTEVRPDLDFDEFADLVKERLPDEMSGKAGRNTPAETVRESIPVAIEEVTDLVLQDVNYYNYVYREEGIPSGCVIRDGTGYAGTLGPFTYDVSNGEWVFLTAAHVAKEHNNDKFYQPYAGSWSPYHFADVNRAKCVKEGGFDAAVLHNLQENGTWKFAGDGGHDDYQGPTNYGFQSKSGLNDMPHGATIHKQGVATGRDDNGTLRDVHPTSFEADVKNGNGDSGGPYWVEENGETLISGIHYKGATDEFDTSRGTIMEAIVDRFNLSTL